MSPKTDVLDAEVTAPETAVVAAPAADVTAAEEEALLEELLVEEVSIDGMCGVY